MSNAGAESRCHLLILFMMKIEEKTCQRLKEAVHDFRREDGDQSGRVAVVVG